MSQALEDYIANLAQLTILKDGNTKGSLRWYVNWYEAHFPSARLKYRLAGVGVLGLAFYIAFSSSKESFLSLEFVGALTAILVALDAFFAWGSAWKVYFQAKVRLEFLLQAYEATIIDARAQSDDSKAIEIVRAGFFELLQKSADAIVEEAKGYFEHQRFPSLKDAKG